MSYDYDFEVDNVEDDVFIITASSKTEESASNSFTNAIC